MSSLRLSHEIRASTREVFDLANDFTSYPEFFQGPDKIYPTTARQHVGTRVRMDWRLAGVNLPVELETTEVIPEKKIHGVFVSGLEGNFDWDFDPREDTTWVTVTAEYRLPQGMAVPAVDRNAMDRDLCTSVQKTLAAMKRLLESDRAAAA